jgi:hypothetical protein
MAGTRSEVIGALADNVASPLTEPEIEACLALAAAAAHGPGDRTTAPLVSFLAGIAASRSDDRQATLNGLRPRLEQRRRRA